MAQYLYRTEPFPHQAKIFRESVGKAAVSLFLQAGLGKTKIIIDKAAFLFQQGRINALVVVAPNGVHRNWSSDEVPVHMPLETLEQSRIFAYHSQKAKTQKVQRELQALTEHKGLAILLVPYEACITPAFKLFFKKFLTKRKAMLVLDESHRIKSATSRIKHTLVAMGAYAPYRRILTGTPIEVPPDIYSQIRFLDPEFWKKKGLPTKAEFDAMFCVYGDQAYGRGAKMYKPVVGYRNIETLATWVKETGYQMTLGDAGIVLPPVIYSKRYHALTSEQKRAYNELRDECRTILASGDLLETEVAMTKLLRLQQIICGYVSTEAEQPIQRINPDGKNPRLEVAVDDVLLELPHQAIIWARFTEDINQLMDALGRDAVRYDGQVGSDDRARAKAAFQKGDKKYIVMSEAGAEGLTLVGSKTMLFYSNDFKMIKRVQKEARMSRIGQKDVTHVIDMVCEGTVDERIIDALRAKKELADLIGGGSLRAWL
jgi:SNF2 family DNA or RNA helicase